MMIRPLALALLLVATHAQAATRSKSKPAPVEQTPVENIDVDAMARAKDAGATSAPADALPTSDSASATSTETPPSDVDAAPKDAVAAPAAAETSSSDAPATALSPAPKEDAPQAPSDDERRLAAACESRSTSLLDSAQKADYANATRDFDAKMRAAMPAPKFKEAWESLSQFGALTARGQSHVTKGDGYIAVKIPLIFEKANLFVQVACGSDGRVAGLYFKPLEIPKS